MTMIALAQLGMAGNLAGFGFLLWSGIGLARLRRSLTPEALEAHRQAMLDLARRIDQATAQHEQAMEAVLKSAPVKTLSRTKAKSRGFGR
ncbi:MAG: hypothetical protein Q8P50_15210 [Bacillota bacterium]|nr:hypothetical protein [Bacillota bacterium]